MLGVKYLGLDGLFTSVLQMLNISELGFSSAIVFSMYKPIVDHDETTICSLLNLYRKVYRIVGIVVLVLGIAVIPFLPQIIKSDIPQNLNLVVLYLIFLTNTVVGYWMFSYRRALLTAHQRGDVIYNINAIVSIIKILLQILVIFLFHNYYLYLLVMIFTTLLENVFVYIQTKRLFPQYVCRGILDQAKKGDIVQKLKGLMVQKLCSTSRNSMDNVIISVYIGLTAVASYGNYYLIMVSVKGLLSSITSGMAASIGDSIARETPEKNHDNMLFFNFMYMWIGGVCTICLLCLFQPFMKIWMGEMYLLSNNVVLLICIYFYSLCIGEIRTLYMTGAGLWWEGRYRAVFEAITNIVLNIVLGKYFGIAGVVMATIISILVINFGYGSVIIYQYYFKNGKALRYYGHHIKYALITGFVAVIVYYICTQIPDKGLPTLILKAIVCFALSNFLYLLIYCKNAMLKKSILLVKSIIVNNKRNH